ncbi:hypothetical protein TIFTF001_055275, partial [Ficus carica]
FEERRLIIFSTRYIGIENEGSRLRKALPVAWIHRTCAHTHSETWNSRIIEKTRWSNALSSARASTELNPVSPALSKVQTSPVSAQFESSARASTESPQFGPSQRYQPLAASHRPNPAIIASA